MQPPHRLLLSALAPLIDERRLADLILLGCYVYLLCEARHLRGGIVACVAATLVLVFDVTRRFDVAPALHGLIHAPLLLLYVYCFAGVCALLWLIVQLGRNNMRGYVRTKRWLGWQPNAADLALEALELARLADDAAG